MIENSFDMRQPLTYTIQLFFKSLLLTVADWPDNNISNAPPTPGISWTLARIGVLYLLLAYVEDAFSMVVVDYCNIRMLFPTGLYVTGQGQLAIANSLVVVAYIMKNRSQCIAIAAYYPVGS